MAEPLRSTKILRGKAEIMAFFQFPPAEFDHFRRLGFPLLRVGRALYCHAEVAENWFAQVIIQSRKKNPVEVDPEAEE